MKITEEMILEALGAASADIPELEQDLYDLTIHPKFAEVLASILSERLAYGVIIPRGIQEAR